MITIFLPIQSASFPPINFPTPSAAMTIVSMNPVMVDGTGMCGACRITVDGETKFACVDGPEFDGHKVNFEEAMRRQTIYKTEEVYKNEGIKPGCGLGGTK